MTPKEQDDLIMLSYRKMVESVRKIQKETLEELKRRRANRRRKGIEGC
ncbi:MAG TPA: hypothetical protein VMV86_03245 [Methanosarcinales archaeon]|nr:hypothetical protein [Methanosarcinales archaeon]